MNAAFLLVTSAMLVGQAGGAQPAPQPSPAKPAVVSTSCGQDPCGCERFGHRLRDKLRSLFNRDSCDPCQPTTCHEHGHRDRKPLFHSRCDDACKPTCQPARPHCPPATCSDPCDHGGFLAKLREKFHRGDRCCEGGCSTVTPKAGEKIDSPKKMPAVPKGGDKKKPQEVRIINQPTPIAPNVIQVAPPAPSVEFAPVPTPRIEGDRRDPF